MTGDVFGRIWSSADGKHKTEAVMIEFRDGLVHLKKPAGRVVIVPLKKLSDADQHHVALQTKPVRPLPKIKTPDVPLDEAAPIPPPKHAPDKSVIYLQELGPEIFTAGPTITLGVFNRELGRQAFLIAARDELRLTTRDADLGQTVESHVTKNVMNFSYTSDKPSKIVIRLAGAKDRRAEHTPSSLQSLHYLNLIEHFELMSRDTFVSILKRAGYKGSPHPRSTRAGVPDSIATLLNEMTLTSQFLAARQIHNQIRKTGESPELLAALVRAYAHLGVLTECRWDHASDIFQARSLLYAQRLATRWKDNAHARWHRAYALALAGLHRYALADIVKARSLKTADDVVPVWAELSWPVLGHLMREMAYLQVLQRTLFLRRKLSVSADDFIAESAPLVSDHPYRELLGAFALDPQSARRAALALAKRSYPALTIQGVELAKVARQVDQQRGKALVIQVARSVDMAPREYYLLLGVADKNMKTMASNGLLKISPFSPLARIQLLQLDWKAADKHVKQWEETADGHAMLLTYIGRHYRYTGRSEDAERSLKSAMKLSSHLGIYRELAELYKRQRKLDKWLATMESFLEQPDYGLAHATVNKDIAWHFIERREWKKAEKYANTAAESYANWGLQVAAAVQEALGNWKEAEALNRAMAERYRSSALDWWFFCKRTGKGDLKAATAAATAGLRTISANTSIAPHAYYQINGDLDKARKLLNVTLGTGPIYPTNGLWHALVCDDLKDKKARDKSLARLLSTEAEYRRKNPQLARLEIVGLARVYSRALAQGEKGRFELKGLAMRPTPASPNGRFAWFNYFVGKCFLSFGQRDEAISHLKMCMAPSTATIPSTLAGQELLKLGVTAEQWQAELQKPIGRN